MKKYVGYLLAVMFLLLSVSLSAAEGKDRDDRRADQVKEKTHHVVKMQKDGKIVVVTKQSNRPMTQREQRKAAQLRNARAKAVPQNAKSVVPARNMQDQLQSSRKKDRR